MTSLADWIWVQERQDRSQVSSTAHEVCTGDFLAVSTTIRILPAKHGGVLYN